MDRIWLTRNCPNKWNKYMYIVAQSTIINITDCAYCCTKILSITANYWHSFYSIINSHKIRTITDNYGHKTMSQSVANNQFYWNQLTKSEMVVCFPFLLCFLSLKLNLVSNSKS